MTAARKWNDSNFHWNVSVSFIKLISNHLMILKWRIQMYQWRIWHFKQIRRCSLSVSFTFIDLKWLFGLFIFKFKVIESFSPVLRPFDEYLRVFDEIGYTKIAYKPFLGQFKRILVETIELEALPGHPCYHFAFK